MSGLDDELDELISDLAAPYIPNLPATPKKENNTTRERKPSNAENQQNATTKPQPTLTTSGTETNDQHETEIDSEYSNLNLMQLEEEILRESELLERAIRLQEDKKRRLEQIEIERQKISQQRKELEAILERKRLEQLRKQEEEKSLEEAQNNVQLREQKDYVRNVDNRKSVKPSSSKTDKKPKEDDSTPPKSVIMIPQIDVKKPPPSTPHKGQSDKKDKQRKESVDEAPPTPSSTNRMCATCGKNLMESAKFCAMCGTPTTSGPLSPRKKEKKDKKEKTGKDTSSSSDTDDRERIQKMKVLEDIKASDPHQRLKNSNERVLKPISETEEEQKEKQFASAREEMLQEIQGQGQKKKNIGRKFSIWGNSKEDKEKPEKEVKDKHDKKSKDK